MSKGTGKIYKVRYRSKEPGTVYNDIAKVTTVPAPSEALIPERLADKLSCSPSEIIVEHAEEVG